MKRQELLIRVSGVDAFAQLLARSVDLMLAVEQNDVPYNVRERARDLRATMTEHGFPLRRPEAQHDDEGR